MKTVEKDKNLIPVFTTDRLILKGITLEDAAFYQQNFADYEVIRHLAAAVPWPYPDNDAAYFIENIIIPNQGKERWIWGLFLKSVPNEIIGGVDLWRKGHPENRGFWLLKKCGAKD